MLFPDRLKTGRRPRGRAGTRGYFWREIRPDPLDVVVRLFAAPLHSDIDPPSFRENGACVLHAHRR